MKGFGLPQNPQSAMPPANPAAASTPPNFHDMLWHPGAKPAMLPPQARGMPPAMAPQQPGAGNVPGGVPLSSLFNIAFGS